MPAGGRHLGEEARPGDSRDGVRKPMCAVRLPGDSHTTLAAWCAGMARISPRYAIAAKALCLGCTSHGRVLVALSG